MTVVHADGDVVESVAGILAPSETVEVQVEAQDAVVVLTDRRLLVQRARRLALDTPVSGLRRIQFDVEKDRMASLAIVPDDPANDPQMLAIPVEAVSSATRLLDLVAGRISAD